MQVGLLTTFKNNHQTRGSIAIVLSALLFGFYVVLYWTPLLDPVAKALHLSSKWNIYGILYTAAIVFGGIYFLRKHGNSRYQRLRTLSVMFFQVVFAFSIPWIMELFNMRGFTFSIFWPLKIDYLYPSYILNYPLPLILYTFLSSLILVPILSFIVGKRWYCSWVCGCGGLAETAGEPFRHLSNKSSKAWRFEKVSIYSVLLFAFFGTILVIVNWSTGVTLRGELVPPGSISEYATTADTDHLVLLGSSKLAHPYDGKSIWSPIEATGESEGFAREWQLTWSERMPLNDTDPVVLDFTQGKIRVVSIGPGMDGQMFGTWAGSRSARTVEVSFPQYPTFSIIATKVQGIYSFVVVALLSGILGVGLYPILGSRVWCRFFCPLAALMGLIQKFGRFRITVKDDMCISCGNCSTYCEMGIDVRSYAQTNQDFTRSACVGCGICAHVCPRGVLKLENKWNLSTLQKTTNIKAVDL